MIELVQVKKWQKGQPATTPEKQRLKANMEAHYSEPEGFVGRSLIYEVWYDGVFYGHIAGGSATQYLPGRPSFFANEAKPSTADLNHIVNNTFFHIEPGPDGYPLRNFSQAVVKTFMARVIEDWPAQYKGDEVWAFETLVEPPRTGEVYLRSGFTQIGTTKGETCKRGPGARKEGAKGGGTRVWNRDDLCPKNVFWKWAVDPAGIEREETMGKVKISHSQAEADREEAGLRADAVNPATHAYALHVLWDSWIVDVGKENKTRHYPEVLQNPNLPFEDLLQGALEYPEIAELNPARALLALEHPAMAEKLNINLNKGWLGAAFDRLPENTRRLLAVSFAERALPGLSRESQEVQNGAAYALKLAKDVANGFDYRAGEMEDTCKSLYAWAKQNANRYEEPSFWAVICAGSLRFEDKTMKRNITPRMGNLVVDMTAYWARMGVSLNFAQFLASATDGSDTWIEVGKEEEAWQVEQVRLAFAQRLRDEEKKKEKQRKHKKIRHSGKNEAAAQEEVEKQVKIDAAIQQAKEGSAKIRAIMSSNETADWPAWVGLGLVAAGTTACLLLGPEILAGAAVGQGLAELGVVGLSEAEVSFAAEEAAGSVLSISESTGIATVSLGEVEAAASIGEMISADQAAMLAQLVAKLSAHGVTVVSAVAEVVVRMPK